MFSFTICDETADMKVTAFKEDCDRFYDIIQKGDIYQISNGILKPKNRQYNNTQCDYELTLARSTLINKLDDADE